MQQSALITIPKRITGGSEELVVLSRRELERLLKEAELLHLSRDARRLKKIGKLPALASLRQLR